MSRWPRARAAPCAERLSITNRSVRARAAGVARAFVILAADDAPELAQAGAVVTAWPEVRFSIGVHPHAGESPVITRDLWDLNGELQLRGVIAVGTELDGDLD